MPKCVKVCEILWKSTKVRECSHKFSNVHESEQKVGNLRESWQQNANICKKNVLLCKCFFAQYKTLLTFFRVCVCVQKSLLVQHAAVNNKFLPFSDGFAINFAISGWSSLVKYDGMFLSPHCVDIPPETNPTWKYWAKAKKIRIKFLFSSLLLLQLATSSNLSIKCFSACLACGALILLKL